MFMKANKKNYKGSFVNNKREVILKRIVETLSQITSNYYNNGHAH